MSLRLQETEIYTSSLVRCKFAFGTFLSFFVLHPHIACNLTLCFDEPGDNFDSIEPRNVRTEFGPGPFSEVFVGTWTRFTRN